MFSYIWPIALAVLSNVFYHICARAMPEGVNPLASLTVTYLVGAAASAILFLVLYKDTSLIREYSKLNWVPFMFGFSLVGLEVGFIYAYKAGWQVSTASVVQSAFLAVVLVVAGFLLYHEALTWNKVLGAAICLIGIAFINYN